jgi:2-polyprenyl-6-methoxyphenol hydroxylase-like FAD-dependent oxidoreductase
MVTRERAIVVGSGMAGLLAARVAADHFAEVLLAERDLMPPGPGARRGTPQDRHNHLLLAGGQRALDGLFPGMMSELTSAGAVPFDYTQDMLWLSPFGWVPRFRSGITLYSCSRHLLEWRVRERIEALPNVRVVPGHAVIGLLVRAGRVTGVRVRPSAERGRSGTDLGADLVVDASGRGSHLPRWLNDLGLAAADETVVDAHLAYATLIFQGAPRLPDGFRAALIQSSPPTSTRGGIAVPIEGDRTLVTLLARGGDRAPTDEGAFRAFAQTLRDPAIHRAVEGLTPLGQVANSRATQNRLRHYERVTPWPDGLVVLGDAVCALNPVYQQGMTTGARGALVLGELLRRRADGSLTGMGRDFQRRLARANATPWLLALVQDLRVAGVVAARPGRLTRLRLAYVRRVSRATTRPEVLRALLEVRHMLRPGRALLRPVVVRGVVADALAGHRPPGWRPR